MENSPVKVNSIGFDDRSKTMLAQAFSEKANGACIFTPEVEAEVVLLNLDAFDIEKLYAEYKLKNRILPEIGVCKENNSHWEIPQVNTPISTQVLVETIKSEMDKKMGDKINNISDDKFAAAMRAIEARNVTKGLANRREKTSTSTLANRTIPNRTDEMCFDIERFLLGHVMDAITKAKKENKSAVLHCLSDKTILFNHLTSEIITDIKDSQIRSLAIAPIDDNLSSPLRVEYVDPLSEEYISFSDKSETRKFSHEVFMWNLGSMTCRGRIPIDASISERQYLIRWPNITRIKLGDNAMRIISFWVKQPCSLYDIQQALDVPLQDVFMVYTAAFSAGLANNAKRNVDHLLEVPDVQTNKRRGLFKQIVSRLKNIKSEAA